MIAARCEHVVREQDTFVVPLQDGAHALASRIPQPGSNTRPLAIFRRRLQPTLILDHSVQRVQIKRLSLDHRDLQRRTLQLPEFGDLIEEVEFDPCLGFELVETLHTWRKAQLVHIDGERRLPCLRWTEEWGEKRHTESVVVSGQTEKCIRNLKIEIVRGIL